MLEMEREPGGNSRWGENEITAYPVGRALRPGSRLARHRWCASCSKSSACSETANGTTARCASPRRSACSFTAAGRKASSPEIASTGRDREDYRRFQTLMLELRATGQFTIPMERGAKPSALDRISMQEWMAQQQIRVAVSELVHQLRLPRRLRRAGPRNVGLGRHPLFRLPRAGRKRSAGLARRQRLDRPAADRTR